MAYTANEAIPVSIDHLHTIRIANFSCMVFSWWKSHRLSVEVLRHVISWSLEYSLCRRKEYSVFPSRCTLAATQFNEKTVVRHNNNLDELISSCIYTLVTNLTKYASTAFRKLSQLCDLGTLYMLPL